MSDDKCIYEGPCCFRNKYTRRCSILKTMIFGDGRCHFQKETLESKNKYDEDNRRLRRNGTTQMERRCRIVKLRRRGMSIDEIAEAEGILPATVKRHLELARVE